MNTLTSLAVAAVVIGAVMTAAPSNALAICAELQPDAKGAAGAAPVEREQVEQMITRAYADELRVWGEIAKLPPQAIDVLARKLMPLTTMRNVPLNTDDELDDSISRIVNSSSRHPVRSWLLNETTVAMTVERKRFSDYISHKDLSAGPVGFLGLSMANATDWLVPREEGGRATANWETQQTEQSTVLAKYVASVMALPIAKGEGVQAVAEILDTVAVESRDGDPMHALAGHERAARLYADLPDADPWLASTWRGLVYLRAARSARGTGWIDSVSPKQLQRMNNYLARAAEHLQAAHALAPHRPLPAMSMMLVALYDGQEKYGSVRKWYDMAATSAPGDARPIDQLINASMPRWGGTPRQMREVIALAASSTRHDTILPYYAFIAAQTLREDIGNGGSPFASSDISANVRKALLPYLSAKSPGVPASKVRTALVLIAYGQKDPVAALEQIAAPGWTLEPRTEIWGITAHDLRDWTAVASSPVSKLINASDAHFRSGRINEALASIAEAAKSPDVAAGSPTASAIARREAILSAARDLDAGKTVELIVPASPISLWRVGENSACVSEQAGALTLSRPRGNAWVTIARSARLICDVPVGSRFEAKLRVVFPKPTGPDQAMLALHHGDRAEVNANDPDWLPSLVISRTAVTFGGIGLGRGGPIGGVKSAPNLEIKKAEPEAPILVTFKFDQRRGRAWIGHGPEPADAISFSDADVGADRGAAGPFFSFTGGAGAPYESGPIRIESVSIRKLGQRDGIPATAPNRPSEPRFKLPPKAVPTKTPAPSSP